MTTRRDPLALLRALLAGALAVLLAALPAAPAARLTGAAAGSVAAAARRPHVADAALPAGAAAAVSLRASTAGVVSRAPAAASMAPNSGATAAAGDAWARAQPHMEGTYLPEVVAAGHSRVRRWVDDRGEAPVRVWIARGDSVLGWNAGFLAAVHGAFGAWETVGIPVRFAFVDAAEDAEVLVEWAERLAEQRAGVTHWTANPDGWLTRARIVLATVLSDGGPATDATTRRMALHEIGHLLGLEHSGDAGDIMAAWVKARDLSERDRATARLLYTLPAGTVAAEGPAAKS